MSLITRANSVTLLGFLTRSLKLFFTDPISYLHAGDMQKILILQMPLRANCFVSLQQTLFFPWFTGLCLKKG